jgi:raffinose/stachyose/melibiose transport system permease protein
LRISVPVLFYLFVAGIVLPIHVTLIPLFVLMRDLDLLGRLNAVVFPFVGFSLPVSIFILRGFFEQLPMELEDAARIDGASTAGIFFRIALPLARPALVTVFILSAVAAWKYLLC